MKRRLFGLIFSLVVTSVVSAGELSITTFQVDVTPPLGSPLCLGLVPPVEKIDDPLFVRGILILGAGEPIVLCAVDFVGIGNGGHDAWREAIARAAGTDASRVAVQTLHQHDAPGCDFDAEEILVPLGFGATCSDVPFLKDVLRRVELAIKESLSSPLPLTHVGFGHAKVDRVASSRRILDDDGKVKIVRWSSTKDPEAIAAPEGLIDPDLKLVSFWNQDKPLVSMTYFATHPQSHYGKGAVSADFVGLARAARDRQLPGVFHLHFDGAGGNITAGKYNDGSEQARTELTERLAAGMKSAWDNVSRVAIQATDAEWKIAPVVFPLSERLKVLPDIEMILLEEKVKRVERGRAACDIAYAQRVMAGHQIDLTCLRLGSVAILNLPGETFVEYQLAAQQMRPDLFVCTAAYGDYGPGYIGTTVAYAQGGYETTLVSRTAAEVEPVYLEAICKLLK